MLQGSETLPRKNVNALLLLMEETLHKSIGSLSQYLQGFVHPRWCRISSINSITLERVPNQATVNQGQFKTKSEGEVSGG